MEILTSPREWQRWCFGPQDRLGARVASLCLKPKSHHCKPLLPTASCIPESHCHVTCVPPQCPAPSRPSWWPSLSQALSLFPACFFSSLSIPPGHPSPGWCLGLSITSRAAFHTLLKHPQNPSPGRRETLFRNRPLLLSEVGNRPAAMSQSTSACNICLLSATGLRPRSSI